MKKTQFEKLWKQYEPTILALVELMNPFLEAAVHDLEQGKIVALYRNISQRKIGDPSPLKELKVETQNFPDYFEPYYKTNWDGRPLKCTSITIRDDNGKAVGLICFNFDTSHMQEAQQLLGVFLKTKESAANPIEQFGAECEVQVAGVIQRYLEEKRLGLNFLNRQQKKELVLALFHKGIFNYKSAVPFIAKKLKISRASIYNYIK